MGVNKTDNSSANDRTILESKTYLIAGYNKTNDEVREVAIGSDGQLVTSGMGGNGVESDVSSTAWGIPSVSQDLSLFHSLFTYDVNGTVWKGIEDGTENLDISTSTRIVSDGGSLNLKTTATNGSKTELISFKSPRYQPNRGHRYSTTVFSEDIGTTGATFKWGLGYFSGGDVPYTGCYFEITDDKIYAVVRNFGVYRDRTDITASVLEKTGLTITNLQKGNLYDIQFQWRGIGNYFFYVNLKLVYTAEFLSTLDRVSIENPQLPTFYQVKNNTAGKVLNFRSGCTDITTEGGKQGSLTDASPINEDIVVIPNDILKHHLLVVRVKETFKTKVNTRNSRLLRFTATPFGKDMNIGFSLTRDSTTIGGTLGATAFTGVNPYSSLEFIDMSQYTETEVSFDFNNANVVTPYQAASKAGDTFVANEPNTDLDLYFSAGDIIVLFVKNIKTGTGGEASGILELGEEI